MISGMDKDVTDKDVTIDAPGNVPIRQMHQDCTINQGIGEEAVKYEGCKDVYIFASGTVVVPGIASDKVLHPAAGPIKITRTGKS